MDDLDSYIFLDMDKDVPEEKRVAKFLCTPCRNKLRPNEGWDWPASAGYGPWDFECSGCGIYLHKKEEEDDGED